MSELYLIKRVRDPEQEIEKTQECLNQDGEGRMFLWCNGREKFFLYHPFFYYCNSSRYKLFIGKYLAFMEDGLRSLLLDLDEEGASDDKMAEALCDSIRKLSSDIGGADLTLAECGKFYDVLCRIDRKSTLFGRRNRDEPSLDDRTLEEDAELLSILFRKRYVGKQLAIPDNDGGRYGFKYKYLCEKSQEPVILECLDAIIKSVTEYQLISKEDPSDVRRFTYTFADMRAGKNVAEVAGREIGGENQSWRVQPDQRV